MATTDPTKLPHPGEERAWFGEHQPTKQKTPLRLELRERATKGSTAPITRGRTRLIAYADTVATPEAMREAALTILDRAARVDEFVGLLPHEEAAQ